MATLEVYTNSIMPTKIEGVNRICIEVDGLKYNFVPLGNGWLEIKNGGEPLMIRHGATIAIREDPNTG